MRTLTMIIAVAALSGCQTKQDLCRDEVNQTCEREFSCRTDAEKATPQFIAAFGTSVDDCKTKLYANPLLPSGQTGVACDQADTDQEVCSNWGRPTATMLVVAKANQCHDARAALSCADWLAQFSTPSSAPAICAQRCQ